MGSYYYLVSQLPYLFYGQKPPMSSEAFRELLCRSLVDPADMKLLDTLQIDPVPLKSADDGTLASLRRAPAQADGPSYANYPAASGCEFIDRWRDWERTLRLTLAKHRSIKTKREDTSAVEPPIFPADAVSVAVKAAVGTENPLDAEIMIDKARWNAIDVSLSGDYFDRNTVFAYYLKLLLLERHELFQVEAGFNEYNSLYSSILEKAQSDKPLGVSK